jgi:hypothetical protein
MLLLTVAVDDVLNVQSLHCRDTLEEKLHAMLINLLLDLTGMVNKVKRKTILFLVLCGIFEK